MYTSQETREFKRKRNNQRDYDRGVKKSVWEFNSRLKLWINNYTQQRAIFNASVNSFTFVNS